MEKNCIQAVLFCFLYIKWSNLTKVREMDEGR